MKLEFKLLGAVGLVLLVLACVVAFVNHEATGPRDAASSNSAAETPGVQSPDVVRETATTASGTPVQERTTTPPPVDERPAAEESPDESGLPSAEDGPAAHTPEVATPERTRNEFWRVEAVQDGFNHRPRNGKLVLDHSDLDEEIHVPRDEVKRAYGFDAWFKPRDGLIPGFKFDLAEHPELAEFSVHSDDSHACFTDHVGMHGVERMIQLRRGGDEAASIAIFIVVALSVDTAQEKMVPYTRQSHVDVVEGNASLINRLPLGDVNYHHSTHDDRTTYVAFTRHNVYFSIDGQTRGGKPIDGMDFVAFAQTIDAAIQAIAPISIDELEALRPRVTRFELEKDTLHGPKQETKRCAVYWDVDAPRGGKLTVFADGPDCLQYDDRTNPAVIRGSTEGKHTARLVVIDEWLLFDWQDAPVEVR